MKISSLLNLVVATGLLLGTLGNEASAVWIGSFSGTQNYNNPANWAGGIIDDTVVGSMAGGMTLQFTANRSTVGDLTVQGTAGSSNWNMTSTGGPRTIFLNGNFNFDRTGTSAIYTIGSATPSNNLTIDLMGGFRQFNGLADAGDTMNIFATVTNGGIHITTPPANSNTIAFVAGSNPSYTGQTRVDNGTLRFDVAPASLNYDVRNAANLHFNGVPVTANANVSLSNASTLTLSGAAGVLPTSATFKLSGTSILQLGNGTGNNNDRISNTAVVSLANGGLVRLQGVNAGITTETVSVAADGYGRLISQNGTGAAEAYLTVNLDRTNRGVLAVGGTNLGAAAAPLSQILFGTTPTTIGGGGGAGTTNISIVPYLFGGSSAPTLATYGATGVRLLDTTTEFVNYNAITGSDPTPATITGAANDANVRVVFNSNAGFTLTSPKTLNSLTLQGLGGNVLSGASVLTLTSGVLAVAAHNNPFVIGFAGLNFGAAEGVITLTNSFAPNGKLTINSVISGSNGVTLTGALGLEAGNPNFNKFEFGGNNNYTGQTTINNTRLQTLSAERIPDASVVRINAGAELRLGGLETVAGLTGTGAVVLGSQTIAVGQASGNLVFDGLISGAGNVAKIQANTQTLTSNNTYTGTTSILAGALLVNGTTTGQGNYFVTGTGQLGGDGTIGLAGGQSVNVAVGAAFTPGDGIGTLTINGNTTINGSLKIEINGLTNESDLLDVNGTLTLGPSSVLDLDAIAPLDKDTPYVIARFDNLSGWFGSFLHLPGSHQVLVVGNEIVLMPVPEPSSLLLGLGVLLPMLSRRRRKA